MEFAPPPPLSHLAERYDLLRDEELKKSGYILQMDAAYFTVRLRIPVLSEKDV
ncbi:hypothetical protein KEJ49_05335 [Candidatus Bathyarchaeota archaeon]|nr:hypothetical protein [Candidatus Bathyarchaeota archaeon]